QTSDTIFANGFEDQGCGFGVPPLTLRQLIGDVSFLSNPARHYLQPLQKFGDLFGFYFNCPGMTCTDVTPFPGTATVPILRTSRSGYVALEFNTQHIGAALAGYQVVSTSNQVFSRTEWSYSDRCGDFDRQGPWLSAHPECIKILQPKNGYNRWTVTSPSAVCQLLNDEGVDDPNRTWWLNFRVLDCDTLVTCNINVKNQP